MTVQELRAYMSLCRLWKQKPTKEGLTSFVKAARAQLAGKR